LTEWGIHAQSVVGHSSGEIAAACAAGYLTPEDAIKIAFYRGQAAKELESEAHDAVGMMAAGLGAAEVERYLSGVADTVQIACFNSPSSVTLSGKVADLEVVRERLQADSHFARMLQVNLAYHSKYMKAIGEKYETLLKDNCDKPLNGNPAVSLFSSVTGINHNEPMGALYWKTNMVSPVRFDEACTSLLSERTAADFLIEIGPSGALAGPVGQIKKALPGQGANIQYFASSKRGPDSFNALFDVVGRLFISGLPANIRKVNRDERLTDSLNPSTIVDLPNYTWNHSTKYWHESEASKEWRYRPYVHHDLLGSKILGTAWSAPTFSKILDIKDIPWLKDHKMGPDTVFPAAGFCAMAVEALFQSTQKTNAVDGVSKANQLCYRLRDVKFDNALVLDDNEPTKIKTILSPYATGSKGSWYQFKVISSQDDVIREHCSGLGRLENISSEDVSSVDAEPLKHTSPGHLWYKAMADAGYGFGPAFQRQLEVESTSGQRTSRSLVDLREPPSAWSIQSPYPLHPACIDGCFQTVTPSLVAGIRSNIKSVLIPALIDDLVIFPNTSRPDRGVSVTSSKYVGKGRQDDDKNYTSSCTVHDPETQKTILRLTGLHYHRLDTGTDPLASHTLNCVTWRPDVTFISSQQPFPSIKSDLPETLDYLIDLVAHKKPGLNILEINLDSGDESTVWFGKGDKQIRAAYQVYNFISADAVALVNVESELGSQRSASFSLSDLTKPDAIPFDAKFDLVIVKAVEVAANIASQVVLNAHSAVAPGGHVLFAQYGTISTSQAVLINGFAHGEDLETIISSSGLHIVSKVIFDKHRNIHLARLVPPESAPTSTSTAVKLVNFRSATALIASIKSELLQAGHIIEEHDARSPISQDDIVMVLDELSDPLLTSISGSEWDAVKNIISQRSKLLWVTSGSQINVTHPNLALVHGLFRTIRAEDPGLSLTTLDVESPAAPSTISAISSLIKALTIPAAKTSVESEYVERGGVIHVSRILPDGPVNAFKDTESTGEKLEVLPLHENENCTRLRAERLGTLDSLVFGEIAAKELPIRENCVEVEIYAAGLNFKVSPKEIVLVLEPWLNQNLRMSL
jgi:acyl transferase domain-containing protein